jgi:hypothetical protein
MVEIMATTTETAKVTEKVTVTATITTPMPTPTTVHQGQQQGRYARETIFVLLVAYCDVLFFFSLTY